MGVTYANMGIAHYELGNFGDALKYCKMALEIWEKALGPDHNKVNALKEYICKMKNRDKELSLHKEWLNDFDFQLNQSSKKELAEEVSSYLNPQALSSLSDREKMWFFFTVMRN